MPNENNKKLVHLSGTKSFKESQVRQKMINRTQDYVKILKEEIKKMRLTIKKSPELFKDLEECLMNTERELYDIEMNLIHNMAIEKDYQSFVHDKWLEGLNSEFSEE